MDPADNMRQFFQADGQPVPLLDVHAICDQRDRLQAENAALREMLTTLRPRTLVLRRDRNGNEMVPTQLTDKIDALLRL